MAVHEIIGSPPAPVIPQPLHKVEGRVHRSRDLKAPQACASHRRRLAPWLCMRSLVFPLPLSSRSHCTKSKAGCIVQGISKHRRRA